MSDIDALVETVRREIVYVKARTITGTPEFRDLQRADAALSELAVLARQQSAADAMWRAENDRARTAEAERDRLKAALREITLYVSVPEISDIARAALADVGGTEGFPPGFVWSDEEQRPVFVGGTEETPG